MCSLVSNLSIFFPMRYMVCVSTYVSLYYVCMNEYIYAYSKDAPEIDPALFQPAVKVESKPKLEVVTSDGSNDKRLKQLRKKLDQITKLKERQGKGEVLEHNQVCIHCIRCV